MARCPDCSKMVSLEPGAPELNDFEYTINGEARPDPNPEPSGGNASNIYIRESISFSCEVRIVMNCADCSTEIKEAVFSVEQEIDIPESCQEEGDDAGGKHIITVDKSPEPEYVESTEGKGRGLKTFRGFEMAVLVSCSCGAFVETVDLADRIQASDMDVIWMG